MRCVQSGILGAFRLILCGIAGQVLFAQQPLTLRVRTETAPAGEWAQVKIYCDSPAKVASGNLGIEFDSKVFGEIADVTAFSASGDALGQVYLNDSRVSASLESPSGGLCQLPGVPIVAANVRLLPNATGAGTVILTLPEYSNWTTPQGDPYLMTLVPGEIRVGGAMSVESVVPGGGLQPVGTPLLINGTGFGSNTPVTADGLEFSSVEFVSATQIRATLASASQIAGVPFHVGEVAFFPSLPGAILPLRTVTSAAIGYNERGTTILIQNPHPEPLGVRIVGYDFNPLPAETVTIPPGGFFSRRHGSARRAVYTDKPAMIGALINQIRIFAHSFSKPCAPTCIDLPAIELGVSPLSFEYQTGTAAPPAQQRQLFYREPITGAQIEIVDAPWLRVTEEETPPRNILTIAVDPTGLPVGEYTGAIRVTPIVPEAYSDFPLKTTVTPVTLRVSAEPTIRTQFADTPGSGPRTVRVLSNGTPASFAVNVAMQNGNGWLSTDIQQGTTPADVRIQVNTTGLPPGDYRGTVTIVGPRNSVEESVFVRVPEPPSPPQPPVFGVVIPTPEVTLEENLTAPPGGIALGYTNVGADFQIAIENAAASPWLSLNVPAEGTSRTVYLIVDRGSIPSRTHTPTVVAASGGTTLRSTITIHVVAKPPIPASKPAVDRVSLTLSAPAGTPSAPQVLTVTSEGPFSITTKLGSPLTVRWPTPDVPAQAPVTVEITAHGLVPRSYDDELIVSNAAGETRIPLRVDITATAEVPPVIGSVVNAASGRHGPIAPGEIISLHGMGVGPAPVVLRLDTAGRVVRESPEGARVLINGIPAPIVYGSVDQWNVSVPYEIDGAESATIQAIVNGAESETWTVPVAPASPAFWTINATGAGPAAAINQSGTINSVTNPASRGTVVAFYVNGEGQTQPAGVTASVTGGSGPQPRLPVSVTIGGREATVVFAGAAPGLIAGVMQVNALVPFDLAPGVHQVRLRVGEITSPEGVTIAVE